VTAGEQQQIVLFTAIDNITENQLNYLYEVLLSPSAGTDIINASLSGATSSVIEFTHLNYAQAEELIITIQDAKFTVNTLAVEQARNLLVCQVENNLQVVNCPTGAYFGSSAAVPPSIVYFPTATASTGSVLVTFALQPSTGGQTAFNELNIPSLTAAAAQANSIAFAQAESTLRCVYANAATAAACCTAEEPGNNLGFTYCVPATGPTIEGSATAIGYFSVAENTIFSAVSATEANSLARELSRNSLNCYFPSVGVTATCSGTGSTSLGLTGLGLTGVLAPASTTSVYLEPGAVILYDLTASVTAASEQASILAIASLNCFWSNDTQTAFCPPSGTFTAINNQVYNLAASVTASFNYSSSVTADTIISYESKADSNQQALELARSSLSCIYCNQAVPPTCSGGINETVGATADLVCNVLGEVAQNTAVSLGNILVSTSDGGLNCCYGNEGVTNTNKCSTGAVFSSDPNSTFTSIDTFFLPANVITVCQSTSAPPPPPLYFGYTNLYATDVAQVGCCSDIILCGGLTGSVTALPTLWANQTDLFNIIEAGTTFYADALGAIPYEFPVGTSYVVARNSYRSYRAVTGGTGYTVGLTACNNCSGLYEYSFRGATAVNYASSTAAYYDIFCEGPTAQAITLYSNSLSPFAGVTGAVTSWYTDACGLSAFNPVAGTGATSFYYAGALVGSTGYMLLFSQPGGNTASLNGTYSVTSCPVNRYAYSVYVNNTYCSTASGAMTLYGSAPAPALFTSSTATTSFYTEIFGSSAYSYSGTGYITYVAPDTSSYTRVISGVTAGAPISCNPLYSVTVQWDQASPDNVCLQPNFYNLNNTGFNTNIRTLWSYVENPFSDSATASFYTSPQALPDNLFKPGLSGPVYLSKFSPGDTFRNVYREYSWSNTNSTLKSYTGSFKASPFPTDAAVWAHSATANYIETAQVGDRPNTKFLLSSTGIDGCVANTVYSDIKWSLLLNSGSVTDLDNTYKRLQYNPSGTLYSLSNRLLFDGVGYQLSATASGTAGNSSILLQDLSKVGASFTGAIVRSNQFTLIGDYQLPFQQTAIPTYIESFNPVSGQINLGGYYNKVNTTFSDYPIYVTGFHIEASDWTANQFTCHGDLCDRIEVGHSLFSYYVGALGLTASIGYVNRVSGNTVYYTGAPGYNNFSSYDIGTGASHGSGHVYIQGRQLARFWLDENKTQPIYKNLGSNTNNYLWIQNGGTSSVQAALYTQAQNLILGNTAGSTADFIVAGLSYNNAVNVPTRPYSYSSATEYDPGLDQYYYDTYSYSCTGSVSSVRTFPEVEGIFGWLGTCCDEVGPSGGGATTSACNFYDVYGATSIDNSYYSGFFTKLDTGKYYSQGTDTLVTGAFILDNANIGIPGGSAGTFSRFYFIDGEPATVGSDEVFLPCNSTQPSTIHPAGGSAWMLEYLGYWDSSDPYAPVPFDPTYPDGGTAVNNSSYWSNNNPESLSSGYIFKQYVPDDLANPGCNCGNFIYKEYSLTSGDRYSIWSSTAAAWSSVTQIFEGGLPLLDFNECATACSDDYVCSWAGDCQGAAPAGFVAASHIDFAARSTQPFTVQFDPSAYDVPTNFDFGTMPSVGGTAEDLKAEATQIAQNLVNSFVRCYYLNDFTIAGPCPNPEDFLIASGSADPGEVVSNISKEDANARALLIAESRRICISPDLIGGAGCASTVINNAAEVGNAVGTILLTFNKSECNFTPTVTFGTNIKLRSVTFKQITVCSSTGANVDIYVPDWGGNQANVRLAYRDD
jgi:hypothetical protein